MTRIGLCAALLALVVTGVDAADEPLSFEDPATQGRYEALLEQLRCLVCQNQTLSDSHADLAQDMREEVHRLIAEGRSDDAVRDYLVERYGDFVLYRPPLSGTTWMLWAGPFALLLIAAAAIMRISGRRSADAAPLSDEERARLDALLDERGDGPR